MNDNKTVLSHLGKTLQEEQDYGERLKNDRVIKRFLAEKSLLALILREAIPGLENKSLAEITEMIEGNVQIGSAEIRPHHPEKAVIDGTHQESLETGEGKITFDLKFRMTIPGEEAPKEIIVNVEPQNNLFPGYKIFNRAVYYASRMISEQVTSLADPRSYDAVRDVYTIWLFTDAKKKWGLSGSITNFRLRPEKLVGDFSGNVNCDILNIVYIGLNDGKTDSEMIRIMTLLLSSTVGLKEKLNAVQSAGISVTDSVERSIKDMCDMTKIYEQRGREEGLEEGLEKGIEKGIEALIVTMREFSQPRENIVKLVEKRFSLTRDEAENAVERYLEE